VGQRLERERLAPAERLALALLQAAPRHRDPAARSQAFTIAIDAGRLGGEQCSRRMREARHLQAQKGRERPDGDLAIAPCERLGRLGASGEFKRRQAAAIDRKQALIHLDERVQPARGKLGQHGREKNLVANPLLAPHGNA
jgi:hypothetical protein